MADATSRYSLPYQELTDAPNGADLGQDLAEAVETALGAVDDRVTAIETVPNVQVFTSSGTWTKPAGAKTVHVRVVGGGGGGGAAGATGASQVSFGDGGGGGEYAEGWYQASTFGATVTVTIGSAGAGGVGATPAAGSAGGTTSFGSTITALGGGGGGIRSAGTAPLFSSNGALRIGGTGGTGGDFHVQGGLGGRGFAISATTVTAGDGGRSVLSGNVPGAVAATGGIGVNYGGGGGGSANVASASAQNGGAGAKGVCVVTTYF